VSTTHVEDACQRAWPILMRCQPQRGPTLFGWLCTVATREGCRLAAHDRRALSLDELAHHGDEPRLLAGSPSAADVADLRL
jgi:hypothetical protein